MDVEPVAEDDNCIPSSLYVLLLVLLVLARRSGQENSGMSTACLSGQLYLPPLCSRKQNRRRHPQWDIVRVELTVCWMSSSLRFAVNAKKTSPRSEVDDCAPSDCCLYNIFTYDNYWAMMKRITTISNYIYIGIDILITTGIIIN